MKVINSVIKHFAFELCEFKKLLTRALRRTVSSGNGEKETLKRFDKLWTKFDMKRKDRFFPRDFMWWDEGSKATIWWYAVEDWVTETDAGGFELFDFEGGMLLHAGMS